MQLKYIPKKTEC